MPYPPAPVGNNGPINPFWNAIFQKMQHMGMSVGALQQGRGQGNVVDQFGNATEVGGTNLDQIVVIGAVFLQGGVQVGTGIANGTSGRAYQANLATGTITLTKGSTSATLDSTIGGTFTSGQVIGAADVSDPSSGIPTPAITPGTTFTISSSSITLSRVAAESGTGLYCAACNFILYT